MGPPSEDLEDQRLNDRTGEHGKYEVVNPQQARRVQEEWYVQHGVLLEEAQQDRHEEHPASSEDSTRLQLQRGRPHREYEEANPQEEQKMQEALTETHRASYGSLEEDSNPEGEEEITSQRWSQEQWRTRAATTLLESGSRRRPCPATSWRGRTIAGAQSYAQDAARRGRRHSTKYGNAKLTGASKGTIWS